MLPPTPTKKKKCSKIYNNTSFSGLIGANNFVKLFKR